MTVELGERNGAGELAGHVPGSLACGGTRGRPGQSQHLAELLIGIARAQAAIVQAVENEMAGFRSGRAVPALQNVAHLRDHPEPTLVDLPVRVLLASLGRAGPDTAAIVKDLERLIVGQSADGSPGPDLDFSRS